MGRFAAAISKPIMDTDGRLYVMPSATSETWTDNSSTKAPLKASETEAPPGEHHPVAALLHDWAKKRSADT